MNELEKLSYENESLRKEVVALQSKLAAAVNDLNTLIEYSCACGYCIFAGENGFCKAEKAYGTCNAKWRGVQEKKR